MWILIYDVPASHYKLFCSCQQTTAAEHMFAEQEQQKQNDS